jgi:hypothetical protein
MNLPEATRQLLWEAVQDVTTKATPFGTTEDGDTYAYIVPKGAIHRLVAAGQSAGINAYLSTDGDPPPLGHGTPDEWHTGGDR